MSNRTQKTAAAILDAAQQLLERAGDLTLAEVADASGFSRQSVYLHFASRGGLLLALVEHVDDKLGLARAMADAARLEGTAVERLGRLLVVSARHARRIHRLAMLLERGRHDDEDLAAAWHDRMAKRRRGIRRALNDAAREVGFAPGVTLDEATDIVWASGSPAMVQLLVVERRWTEARYAAWLVRTARATLGDREPRVRA